MRNLWVLPLLFAFALPVLAQDEEMLAGDALDVDMCNRIRDQVMPKIEGFSRMKYRRQVPIFIEPKALWDAKQKATGFAGHSAKHALAFYTPGRNTVTVIPWVIGGYARKSPPKKTRASWVADLEPTLIHELTHAIHHQNFYTEGRYYQASLRSSGISDRDLDRSTVDFLMGEGFPELVSLRTTEYPDRMHRHPSRQLPAALNYMRKYKEDGKEPYRVILSKNGYVDGLNLMHHLQLKAGSRGVRGVLYRPPPRQLLFQPEILATIALDDPPDPDSIFGFLSPAILAAKGVRRACNPGAGRYFEGAYRVPTRVHGCLIGYAAQIGSGQGTARYAFFVAHPDNGGSWAAEQAQSLKGINPAGTKERQVTLPLMKNGVKADVITVEAEDGSRYVRAEARGLVVIAHEGKPTSNLEKRVVLALRSLYIRRPTPRLYDEALAKAKAKIAGN